LLDRPNLSKTERSSKKTEDTLKTSIAASPLLFHAWRFRLPSAHPRDPESDSFLACASKKQRGWRRRACDDASRRSRLRSSVFVGWALCDVLRSSNSLFF
ncbi:unnamed protein product, partial [Laminaria digitata]